MPSNTLFKPLRDDDLSADVLNFRGTGIHGTAAANGATNIDYLLTEDRLIMGAYAILSGHNLGDSMDVQVVDVSGMLGFGANFVINQFVSSWFVDPTVGTQRGMESPYPAKIITGLTLRCIYHNTNALLTAECYFNVLFHKVLS